MKYYADFFYSSLLTTKFPSLDFLMKRDHSDKCQPNIIVEEELDRCLNIGIIEGDNANMAEAERQKQRKKANKDKCINDLENKGVKYANDKLVCLAMNENP